MAWEDGLAQGVQNFGQFLLSPQMPVVAGQAAGAIAPNTWQSRLGSVMSDYGKSNIAAKEATAQAAKSAQMNEWLKAILPQIMAGVKTTPEGVAGPSKVNISTDGQTFTAKVDGDMRTQGGNAPAGTPVGTNSVLRPGAPVGTPAPTMPGVPQAPVQAPRTMPQAPMINPRAYPFF